MVDSAEREVPGAPSTRVLVPSTTFGAGPTGSVTSRAGSTGTFEAGTPGAVDASKGRADGVPKGASGVSSLGFPKQHLVKEGESYWALSRKYYGAGKHYSVIEAANDKARVIAGKTMTIPPPPRAAIEAAAGVKPKAVARKAVVRKTEPSTVPRRRVSANTPNARRSSAVAASQGAYRMYTVRKGDTLSGLAKRFFGDHRLTSRITDANQNLRYVHLQADTTIRIPQK